MKRAIVGFAAFGVLLMAVGAIAFGSGSATTGTNSFGASSHCTPADQQYGRCGGVPVSYVVASVARTDDWASLSAIRVTDLSMTPGLGIDCGQLGPHPQLLFAPISAASEGTTIWVDASAPGFSEITTRFTDGLDRGGCTELLVGHPSLGYSEPGWSESAFFKGQAGPSGVDLAGYTLTRIGLQVTQAMATAVFDPASGLTQYSFAFAGTYLFEGTISSPSACKNGGWKALHGPSGTTFRNQGECIAVATSR